MASRDESTIAANPWLVKGSAACLRSIKPAACRASTSPQAEVAFRWFAGAAPACGDHAQQAAGAETSGVDCTALNARLAIRFEFLGARHEIALARCPARPIDAPVASASAATACLILAATPLW